MGALPKRAQPGLRMGAYRNPYAQRDSVATERSSRNSFFRSPQVFQHSFGGEVSDRTAPSIVLGQPVLV